MASERFKLQLSDSLFHEQNDDRSGACKLTQRQIGETSPEEDDSLAGGDGEDEITEASRLEGDGDLTVGRRPVLQ